jgi:hypothetical protein
MDWLFDDSMPLSSILGLRRVMEEMLVSAKGVAQPSAGPAATSARGPAG